MNWHRWKGFLEYVGGAGEEPPPGMPRLNGVARAVLWATLLGLILAFSGQTSKFIYIDF